MDGWMWISLRWDQFRRQGWDFESPNPKGPIMMASEDHGIVQFRAPPPDIQILPPLHKNLPAVSCLGYAMSCHIHATRTGFEFLEAYVELFSKYTTGVGDVMKIISRKKYSLRSISSNNVIWTGGSTCLNSAVLTQTACLCYPSCFIYLSTAQSCVWFTAWPFQTIKQNINH